MHAIPSAAARRPRTLLRAASLLPVAFFAACGGSGGSGGQSGVPGSLGTKSATEFFIVDENQSGSADDFHLRDVRWGRLVDVYDVDANSQRSSQPVFRDFVIDPLLVTNPALGYVLDRNPATLRERLTISNPLGSDLADPNGEDLFLTRLSEASQLPLVLPKDDDGSSAPPFSLVPRNACVVLRFDDCLNDSSDAALNLPSLVRVLTGYAPTSPFQARLLFDPNHGASVRGNFHSTRVLVDLAVSADDASSSSLVPNSSGLPASLGSNSSANVSIRIPTEIDIGTSQFQVLTNLSGTPLDFLENGPRDPTLPTMDIVRAMRSGNSQEPAASNGFLADQDQPRLVGAWAVDITSATAIGTDGLDFEIDLTFLNVCQADPRVGDVIEVGGAFLEVTADAVVDMGSVADLAVRAVDPVANAGALEVAGLYQAPYDSSLPLDPACWVTFLPEPQAGFFPSGGILTTAQIAVRFSEPMDPASLSPFGGFLVVNDEPSGAVTAPNSQNLVVGTVLADPDLRVFTYDHPGRPFQHVANDASAFHVEIGGVKDLGGRPLFDLVDPIPFFLAAQEAQQETDAIVLRFDTTSNDEYGPDGDPGVLGDGRPDLRGQFFLQSSRGVLRGRAVATGGWPIERQNLVPSKHLPLTTGVTTPLTPLGSKLQTVWRHCDVGWHPTDETKTNMDIIGLNWSPVGGLVMTDFYDLFEIRLGHSRFLPDEGCCPSNAPTGGTSGLPPGPSSFEDNYLDGSNPTVVHNRALGYTISVADVFSSPLGTPLLPFPLNRGLGADVTYTWRDTSILTLGADGDATQLGYPLDIERGTPNLPPAGSIATRREVPSYGLPLLIEIKCFPSDRGLGLNRMDVNWGTLTGLPAAIPGFRAYSAGGRNGNMDQVILPDSESVPQGNINPGGNLPSADAIFYLGQIDTVIRLSRVHSVWLDAGLNRAPVWKTPVVEPPVQATGTSVQLDFRSASGFSGGDATRDPFDASRFNPYGNPADDMDSQPQSLTDWSNQISVGNGQRYLQVRFTFVNNTSTGVSPELSALALPYEF